MLFLLQHRFALQLYFVLPVHPRPVPAEPPRFRTSGPTAFSRALPVRTLPAQKLWVRPPQQHRVLKRALLTVCKQAAISVLANVLPRARGDRALCPPGFISALVAGKRAARLVPPCGVRSDPPDWAGRDC